MGRRGNRKAGSRAVQNVRVMDDYAGADGAKFDRVLGQLQNSHSQVTLCVTDEFSIAAGTTATNSILAQSQVRVFDEFQSLAAQFQTYRIKRVRYDIYDMYPGTGSTAVWSTFHDVSNTSNQYVPTFGAVVDAPDSQIIPPGTGKISLVWTAKGVAENEFQSTVSQNPIPIDYGGLRYSIVASGGAVPGKYQVFVKAIVDFRGRA